MATYDRLSLRQGRFLSGKLSQAPLKVYPCLFCLSLLVNDAWWDITQLEKTDDLNGWCAGFFS